MTTTTEARAEFTLAGQRITWVCSACHQSIRKGTGYLEADESAAYVLREQWRQFEKDHGLSCMSTEASEPPLPRRT